MIKYWKKFLLLILAVVLIAAVMAATADLLTLEELKENSNELQVFVRRHYLLAVLAFAVAFFSTAFIVPGALVLTLAAGFLFGTVEGAAYATLFLTSSSTVAFWMSRYIIGSWVQRRYHEQLTRFNAEIERHGMNYLFVLRIVPVMPAFVLNYLSGLTRMSTLRYMLVSLLGISPGALVYALAGRQLASIQSTKDIMSTNVLIGLLLLAVFALLPAVYKRAKGLVRRKT